jgi:hypothetical protein
MKEEREEMMLRLEEEEREQREADEKVTVRFFSSLFSLFTREELQTEGS